MLVVGGDEEVERASGLDRTRGDPAVTVSRAVDPHGDAAVVAVAAFVVARLAVREVALCPDAVRREHDAQ